jgi:hypothetical protein
MLDLPGEKIGHGLEATVGVWRKATDIVVRIVGSKVIEHQKRIELGQLRSANDPSKTYTGPIGGLLADYDSFDASSALSMSCHGSHLA